jgi:hypothetical protein
MECRLYELRNGRVDRCRSLQAARKRHEFVPWIRSSMGTMITGGRDWPAALLRRR